MASNTTDEESQNFHRLVALLIDIGSKALRKLLVKYAVQQSSNLDQHLSKNKTKLDTLQNKRHILSQWQMDLLFPNNGKADEETFDITLLSCLLKNICGKLPSNEKQNIEDLRECRNRISGHMARAALTVSDFRTQWSKISQLITNIAKYSGDVQFGKDVHIEIQDLRKKPEMRPSLRLNDVLLQWYKSDQEVKSQLEIVEETNKQRYKELKRAQVTSDKRYAEIRVETEDTKEAFEKQQSVLTHIKKRLNDVCLSTEGLKCKVKNHPAPVDPALDKLRKVSREFLQINTRQHFVETRRMKDALSMLKQKGHCVISGKPGEGKTMAAATILRHHFNLDKCFVLRQPRDWRIIDIEKTDAIFIDDIFGIYQPDQGRLMEWMDMLPEVEACAGPARNKIKVVIATRSTILDECHAKLSRLNIFKDVVEFSSDQLSEEEKTDMLYLMLQQSGKFVDSDQVRKCVNNFTSPIGFAFCCHLFSTSNSLFSLGAKFFKQPTQFFTENIANLENVKFASMVFLFYKNGEIRLVDLLQNKSEHCRDMHEITTALGMPNTILPSVVKQQLKLINGEYVIVKKGVARFVHSTVLEAIGLLYGKCNPRYVLRACSSDFLHQCVAVENSGATQDEREKKILIEEDSYDVFIDRLISEVIDLKNVNSTAAHPVLRTERFLTLFLDSVFCKHLEKNFLTSKDIDSGITFVSCYITSYSDDENAFISCLSIILKYIAKCDHLPHVPKENRWDSKVRLDCMNACCLCGNIQAYKLLLEHGVVPDRNTLNSAALGGNSDIVSEVIGNGVPTDIETMTAAVRGGNVDIVRKIIEHGTQPTAETLNCAAKVGKSDIVEELLKHGVIPNTEAINCAVEGGNICIVRTFMENGAAPDENTAVCAIWRGDVAIVTAVMKRIDVPDSDIANNAAWKGDVEIVRIVLENGVSPDTVTVNCAIEGGNADAVRTVIEFGALPSKENMLCALRSGNVDIVKTLIEQGAVTDTETMDYAIRIGNVDVVKTMLGHGAVPCINTVNGAVEVGKVGIIAALVEIGAVSYTNIVNQAALRGKFDVFMAMTKSNRIPNTETLNCAIRGGNMNIIRILMNNGASPDEETLSFAIEKGNVDIVKAALVGIVPDANAVNSAIWQGSVEIVKYVLDHFDAPDTEVLNNAAWRGNIDIFTLVMQRGVSPTTATLYCAVEGGNAEIVKAVMEHAVVPDKYTVQCAMLKGNNAVHRTLLEHGAVIDKTALNCARERFQSDFTEAIREAGSIPDTETVNSAVLRDYFEKVQSVCKRRGVPCPEMFFGGKLEADVLKALFEHLPGASALTYVQREGIINDITRGATAHGPVQVADAVNYAVQGDNVDALKNVYIKKAVLGQVAVPDTRATAYAVRVGNVDVVRALLDHGIAPDTETLNLAVQGGNVDIFRTVLEHGAVPDTRTVYYAVQGGNVDIVRTLLDYGIVPDTETLNSAVQREDVDILRTVLEHGAVPDTGTVNYAVHGGNVDIVRALLDYGIVPDTGTLNSAIQGENVDILRTILEHGAVADTRTVNYAVQRGNVHIVRALLDHKVV